MFRPLCLEILGQFIYVLSSGQKIISDLHLRCQRPESNPARARKLMSSSCTFRLQADNSNTNQDTNFKFGIQISNFIYVLSSGQNIISGLHLRCQRPESNPARARKLMSSFCTFSLQADNSNTNQVASFKFDIQILNLLKSNVRVVLLQETVKKS